MLSWISWPRSDGERCALTWCGVGAERDSYPWKELDTVALEVEPGELRVGGCGAYTNPRRRETFGMELSRVT